MRVSAALLFAAAFVAGCASPTTGRLRDAHLLYGGGEGIAEARKAGPFYDYARNADGAERSSFRPLLYTHIEAEGGKAVRREVAWPVYDSSRRGDSLTWRFVIWFGYDKDTDDPDSQYRAWLFPFWFQGKTKCGESYAAFFPIYGTIRDMYWERIHFALFPVWIEYDRNGHESWSVLWPLISKTRGEVFNGFKVFPFYGQMERKDVEKTKFAMWPFWTSGEHYGRNPGRSWMLFPVMGRVERELESSLLVVPPLFNFTRGKGELDYYRKINCPWPLVQIHDTKYEHKRYYLPFWGRKYDDDGTYDSLWVMYPLYHSRRMERAGRLERTHSALFVYADSVISADRDKDGVFETEIENYRRLWPVFSHRKDPSNSYFKFPDLSFSKRVDVLDRNLLGMFTLYTRGATVEPRRVDHELLWGMINRGYGEEYDVLRIWPFYSHRREADEWSWSVLGGLVGREGRGDGSRWRWLWFFGGSDGESDQGEGGDFE